MEFDDFRIRAAEVNRQKREALKRDYADYVREHATSDCLEELLRTRKNAILLDMKKSTDEEIPIGASKSGGYPDLPPTIPIPELSGFTVRYRNSEIHREMCSMQLIAQINLAEFAAYDRDKKLPEKGMLYFFWSGEIEYWDNRVNITFDGENHDVFKVIYYDGDLSELRRVKPELPYGEEFSEPLDVCRITPKLNTYMYDEEELCGIFRGESRENAQSLENEYALWGENQDDRLLGYFNGSLNVTGGENLLFQFSYHEGIIWNISWFIDDIDLAEWKFENSYMRWDTD